MSEAADLEAYVDPPIWPAELGALHGIIGLGRREQTDGVGWWLSRRMLARPSGRRSLALCMASADWGGAPRRMAFACGCRCGQIEWAEQHVRSCPLNSH